MNMNAHKLVNAAAQGDLYIRRIDALPAGCVKELPRDGKFIVAHSETGHHHTIEADDGTEYYTDPRGALRAYLVVQSAIGKMIAHERHHDTHAPIFLGKGIYELRRQREYIPEGWRMVSD